jgi:hypothetical protein
MNSVKPTASLLASTAADWLMTLGAAQECTGGGERFADQALRVTEVGRLYVHSVRGRKDDQFGVFRVACKIEPQPAVGEQAQSLDRGPECAPRCVSGRSMCVARWQNEDALRAKRDGVRDRCVVDDAAVD